MQPAPVPRWAIWSSHLLISTRYLLIGTFEALPNFLSFVFVFHFSRQSDLVQSLMCSESKSDNFLNGSYFCVVWSSKNVVGRYVVFVKMLDEFADDIEPWWLLLTRL